jgi:hypothetical protein
VTDESFFTSAGFTLQWQLTQSCDLHCRHCYDRSARATVALPDALRVLDGLRAFCRARRVSGHVSLSEGYGYEITNLDVRDAYRYTMQAATNAGCAEQTLERIRALIAAEKRGDRCVGKALGLGN